LYPHIRNFLIRIDDFRAKKRSTLKGTSSNFMFLMQMKTKNIVVLLRAARPAAPMKSVIEESLGYFSSP